MPFDTFHFISEMALDQVAHILATIVSKQPTENGTVHKAKRFL